MFVQYTATTHQDFYQYDDPDPMWASSTFLLYKNNMEWLRNSNGVHVEPGPAYEYNGHTLINNPETKEKTWTTRRLHLYYIANQILVYLYSQGKIFNDGYPYDMLMPNLKSQLNAI